MPNKRESKLSLKNRINILLNKTYERFLRIRGEPREIALGFALGLLVGMTPAIGFHIIIAIFFATLFKWNKISAAIAVWITNPITAPVIYSITYMLGAKVMGLRKSYEPTADEVTSTTFFELLKKTPEMFAAMTIGGFIIGIPLSLIGCYLAYTTISKYQEDIRQKLAQQRLRHALKRKQKKEKRTVNKKGFNYLTHDRSNKMDKNETQLTYKCIKCDHTVEMTGSKNSPPECCGTEMELIKDLPACQTTATAEHARPDEMMEPCDDGRQGKV